MTVLVLVVIGVVLLFGMVVAVGAPYLPTLKPQASAALDLLDLKPGQTLLELGSGDGGVALLAARRGIRVVGYELNPLLVVISRLRTYKYRGDIQIIWGNYWQKTWPDCDGVFVFLLDKYMKKLDKKITQRYGDKRLKVASYAFKIPGRKISIQNQGVYLYHYHGSTKSP